MAFCGQCGSKLEDTATFCGECGAKVTQDAPQQQISEPQAVQQKVQPVQQPETQQPVHTQEAAAETTKKGLLDRKEDDNMSETVKTGFYFGMSFLYGIPVIGWGICLFNALINKNKSKRNHARATILTVLIVLAFSLMITFAVKTAVNVAIKKSGIDIEAIKENGISTEIVMDFLEDKGMIPEELADMAGLLDSMTGILGGDKETNQEGVGQEQINQILEQFSGEDGSMDMEGLMDVLGTLESNSSSDRVTE